MPGSNRQPRRWTPAEDQTLREQVDAQQAQGGGRDWCQIALTLPGRTNKDCRKRWHNSVAEGLRKGQWSKPEDQLLTQGVYLHGWQWTKVATCVSSRSADQCAKRWQQSLDPRLDRSEWREHEDMALLAAVERLGRCWKDIQEQCLPHRSKNCVKNRYSVLARRNATQLVPYDDIFGSSSSDPGTPLQTEASLQPELTTAPLMDHTTQTIYTQNQFPPISSNAMSWAPSEFDDMDALPSTSHSGLFSNSPWPTCTTSHPCQVLSNNQGQWNGMQAMMGLQQATQYPTTFNGPMHEYGYPMHHHPHVSPVNPYATPVTRPPAPSAPSSRSPSAPTHRGRFRQGHEDSAFFGQL